MKSIFEIKDQEIIYEVLDRADYGTLAICKEGVPYSLPLNFVRIDKNLYFHGSKNGKKMNILRENSLASFSVVESYSIISSYFSSNENLACPATHFFKSIIIDGKIEFIKNFDEKTQALKALMTKLQKEGGYKALEDKVYKNIIDATTIYKLKMENIGAKFKFGQHLTQERWNMIIEHLQKRGDEKDIATIKLMRSFRP